MTVRYWDYIAASHVNYAEGRYIASWQNLFEAMAVKDEQEKRYRSIPSSPRQQEIQRLWQQRGLLERTKANLRSVEREYFSTLKDQVVELPFHNGLIFDTIRYIDKCIEKNKQMNSTVKERIPSA